MARAKSTPPIDTCRAMTREGAPSPRINHGAVWTGDEMIIWGGAGLGDNGAWIPLGDGARYDPANDRWTPISVEGAPQRRRDPVVLWTGSHVLVCGGRHEAEFVGQSDADYAAFKGAFLYDPARDRWSTAPGLDIYPRYMPAVWTGREALLWAGASSSFYPTSGARFDPAAGQARELPTHAGECKRVFHTAVWTGTEMIIWGGFNGSPRGGGRKDGKAYNPDTNSWREIASTNAPSAREFHTAVWTGTEMIVWGGRGGSKPPANGGRYDPARDQWTPLKKAASSPDGREMHTATWTGTHMVIWGGTARTYPSYKPTYPPGAAFDPVAQRWSPLSNDAPGASNASAVFTGTELLVWGGNIATEQGASEFTDRGFRLAFA